MIIYHGHPSEPSLQRCRELAPSHRHGAEFSDKTGRRTYDEPYIVDNGAYAAYKNGHEWNPNEFEDMLAWVDRHQRDPDFVVVPDVVGDAQATYARGREWSNRIQYTTYQPVQDGMDYDTAASFAIETGSDGLFIGGSTAWKRQTARHWINTAHDHDLGAHLAKPWDLKAAEQLGADSVDTTSVVAWAEWHKLQALEEQTTLA